MESAKGSSNSSKSVPGLLESHRSPNKAKRTATIDRPSHIGTPKDPALPSQPDENASTVTNLNPTSSGTPIKKRKASSVDAPMPAEKKILLPSQIQPYKKRTYSSRDLSGSLFSLSLYNFKLISGKEHPRLSAYFKAEFGICFIEIGGQRLRVHNRLFELDPASYGAALISDKHGKEVMVHFKYTILSDHRNAHCGDVCLGFQSWSQTMTFIELWSRRRTNVQVQFQEE